MDTIFDMTVNAMNQDRGFHDIIQAREKVCAYGSALPTLWGSRVLHIVFFYCVAFFFIIGQTFAYMFQYAEIYQKRSAVGFSLYTCFALLISNSFRLLFWIGRTFSWIVPVSCLAMIFCMLFLMEIAIRMNRRYLSYLQRKSIWRGHLTSNFWDWHDYSSYVVIFLLILAVPSLVSAFLIEILDCSYCSAMLRWCFALPRKEPFEVFINIQPYTSQLDVRLCVSYVELLGYVPTLIEAGLGFPQLWLNYQRKSVSGMSIKMVLFWTAGDIASTLSYFFLATPAQFWICSLIQVFTDVFLLGQVYYYNQKTF